MTAYGGELVAETPYLWRARRPGHRHKLICFAHAGAGAATYADWAGLLPPEVELVAVQLPGRQNRVSEQPIGDVGLLVNALTYALRAVTDSPFSFFGHSCGALLAFETARAMRAKGAPCPEHLFLSAQAAPEQADELPVLHTLGEAEFRAEVLRIGGVEPEIAANEAVMTALLPLLREDFRLWETHRVEPGARVDCPITTLVGDADPRAGLESVLGWRDRTGDRFTARAFPGGHFYFLDEPGTVTGFLSRALQGGGA